MNNKTIIGLIGDHGAGKTTAANILKKRGFHKVSIFSKVEEFATHLFRREEIEKNKAIILNQVRRRGCAVHKEYWLNLVLSTLPDDKNMVIIEDLSIDEIESNKINVYQIYRPNVSTIELPDIKTIRNDGSLRDFTTKIEALLPHKK